jgi:hypothetical protein
MVANIGLHFSVPLRHVRWWHHPSVYLSSVPPINFLFLVLGNQLLFWCWLLFTVNLSNQHICKFPEKCATTILHRIFTFSVFTNLFLKIFTLIHWAVKYWLNWIAVNSIQRYLCSSHTWWFEPFLAIRVLKYFTVEV